MASFHLIYFLMTHYRTTDNCEYIMYTEHVLADGTHTAAQKSSEDHIY